MADKERKNLRAQLLDLKSGMKGASDPYSRGYRQAMQDALRVVARAETIRERE